jgi:hypothetical protein
MNNSSVAYRIFSKSIEKLLRKPILLILITGLLVYESTLTFSFLRWDDDAHILNHPPLSLETLPSILTQPYYGLFIPVIYLLWGIIGRGLSFIGLSPHPSVFHGLNLFLHLVNSLQVYSLIQLIGSRNLEKNRARRSDSTPFSNSNSEDSPTFSLFALSVGSLIFLLHPVQVPTVSWISGARDLLSAAFGLYAIRTFLQSGNLVKTTVLYTLGILSKPSLIFLPVVLILLRPSKASTTWPWILLWFFIATSVVVWTRTAQIFAWMPSVDWAFRPLVAIDAIGFYILKILIPYPLKTDYGRTVTWVINHGTFTVSLIGLTLAGVLYRRFRSRLDSSIETGILWSFLMLFPVLGWFPSAQQSISTVADHYLYLPMAGVALVVTALLNQFSSSFIRGASLAGLILLGLTSFTRSQIWKNDSSFFQMMLKDNPESVNGHIGYGNVLSDQGNEKEALPHYRKAYELAPTNATAFANYAISLERSGDDMALVREIAPVIELLSKSLSPKVLREASPIWVRVWDAVGAAEMRLQQFDAAKGALCRSLNVDPTYPRTTELWSQLQQIVLAQTGQPPPACNP